jgi:DNA-binding transcriptional MerR regulator
MEMKIQEVATKTGLSIHALRYYEQIGLVTGITREDNGHRDYTEDDVYRIKFVTNLRAAGMPIANIKRYIDLSTQGQSTASERLEILEDHKVLVQQHIEELTQHLKLIEKKISHYRESNLSHLPASAVIAK